MGFVRYKMSWMDLINNGREGLMNREVTPTCGRGINIALVG